MPMLEVKIAALPDPPTAASILALIQSIERRDPAAPASLAFRNALLRAGLEADAAGGFSALEALSDAVVADEPDRAGARLTILRAVWTGLMPASNKRAGQ